MEIVTVSDTIKTTEGEMTREQYRAWLEDKKKHTAIMREKKDVHERLGCPFISQFRCITNCAWRSKTGCLAQTGEKAVSLNKRCPLSSEGLSCMKRCVFYNDGCTYLTRKG